MRNPGKSSTESRGGRKRRTLLIGHEKAQKPQNQNGWLLGAEAGGPEMARAAAFSEGGRKRLTDFAKVLNPMKIAMSSFLKVPE